MTGKSQTMRERVTDALYNVDNDHDPVEAVLTLIAEAAAAEEPNEALPVTSARSALGPRQREDTRRAAESAYLYAYQAMQTIADPAATLTELDDAQRYLAAAERVAKGARLTLVKRTR